MTVSNAAPLTTEEALAEAREYSTTATTVRAMSGSFEQSAVYYDRLAATFRLYAELLGVVDAMSVMEWVDDYVREGIGALVICTTEDGDIGVFEDDDDEASPALGRGDTAIEAILRAYTASRNPASDESQDRPPGSEPDDSYRRRLLDAIPHWGAFAGTVSESRGSALDAAGRHLGIQRNGIAREPMLAVSDENDDPKGVE